MGTAYKKKLIEVALPLDAINQASIRENYIYRDNPSAVHKWWAQRPLATARAVLFAQIVDDPSAHPELFPTVEAQEKERQRLFGVIEKLVIWENTTNEQVLQLARDEILKTWQRTCRDNLHHPAAQELFDPHRLPTFHDPFAGGGSIPLEAQRLGLKAYASDLNPVAVLINKALIEMPPKFSGLPPVNPNHSQEKTLFSREWPGLEGLAEDVRYYGRWMRGEAEKRIGHLYPKIEITAEMAEERPDLQPYLGQELSVIAWLWARTVKSPNPAFSHVDVPLAATFMLSTKPGKEVYVEPVIEGDNYRFEVKVGKPQDPEKKKGTKLGRGGNFRCLMSGTPITSDYIKAQGKIGGIGARLMAIVAQGKRGRIYFSPTREQEQAAYLADPEWKPEQKLTGKSGDQLPLYGMYQYWQLFTQRQLVALTTLSDLVGEVREIVKRHALAAGLPDDGRGLNAGGTGATAYADAIAMLLAFSVDKTAEYGCTLVPWYAKEDRPKGIFARQAIPMVWDYAEVNPLAAIGGAFEPSVNIVAGALGGCAGGNVPATVKQSDAESAPGASGAIVSTDPPYYNNVHYADLSDFFYVWLRRSLRPVFPELFTTLASPKAEELVATTYRHGDKQKAEKFFLDGMTRVMHRLVKEAHPAFPITIYYAFKQAESSSLESRRTGWETFLDAVIRSGCTITGTWPMRTERGTRSIGMGANALASSIVLVCRPRRGDAPIVTRRDFINALKEELPEALAHLQRGNIAPVDLAQAAIGPGMAVFTRYSRVLDSEGKSLSVQDALVLINQVLDELLSQQEGEFDPETRWALAWFEQVGFNEGDFGVAETLSKAKNTSVSGMAASGIVDSSRGKVRLLRPTELPSDWEPAKDKRLTVWEIVHHLVRALEEGGEGEAAKLVAKLGSQAEVARELAYRLYTIAERKKRAAEAHWYNSLVQSWPEIMRLAREGAKPRTGQVTLFDGGEEE